MTRWRENSDLAEALRLLDSGAVRAAHEEFEDVWRAHRGEPLGELARALAQWAAACIHWEAQRDAGFRSLGAKCAAALAGADLCREFDTHDLATWMARITAGTEHADPRVLPAACD